MAVTPLTTTTSKTTSTTQTSVVQPIYIVQPSSQANVQSVGNQQTNTTLQPYIPCQPISFHITNMRPNAQVHVFFDSVCVDAYCAPGINASANINTAHANTITRTANLGTTVTCDANGTCIGQFICPPSTFKCGTKTLEVCDANSIVQGNSSITTIGSCTFTASPLSCTNTCGTLTTVNPGYSCIGMTNTICQSLGNTVNTSNWGSNADFSNTNSFFTNGYCDPFAQVFLVQTPHGEAGVFATQVEIFFSSKSPITSSGVAVYIAGTNSNGTGGTASNYLPDSTCIIPFSQVHLLNSQINADPTSNTGTTFVFESPVFLENNTRYALVIKPDANDTSCALHTATLGGTDILTGCQVFNQPLTVCGAFFGSTTTTWCPMQSEYFKFILYVANFTHSSGTGVFNNANTDYITIINVNYPNAANSIMPGDHCYQAANGLVNSTGSTINAAVSGIVTYYDNVKGVIYIDSSTGNFSSNSCVQVHRFQNSSLTTANSSTIVAFGNTYPLYNPVVDGIVAQFATLLPAGTGMTYSYEGTSNGFVVDSTPLVITTGTETMFTDYERIVASKTNEVLNLSGAKSLSIDCGFVTDTNLLSPVIDTTKMHPLTICNNIDPISSCYDEFYNSGFSKTKWISNVIQLAEGQDSQDLQVQISGYRPPGTDLQVWVKFLNGLDPSQIAAKTWTPMVNQNATYFCDPTNTNDFETFTYTIPVSYPMLPTTGTITANATSANVVGVNTLFGTESLVGWYVNMIGNSSYQEISRQIINVTNSTSIVLNEPFTAAYSGAPYFIVPPPTTAYMAANTPYLITGTVTANNNTLIGNNTLFTTEVAAGDTVQVGQFLQEVVSITNNTLLTCVIPWGVQGVANQSCQVIVPAGLTYVANNFSQYSTFLSFQLKVVFQANSSVSVPLMKSITATTLQL